PRRGDELGRARLGRPELAELGADLDEARRAAEPPAEVGDLGDGHEPGVGALRKEQESLERVPLGEREIAPQAERLGLDPAHDPDRLTDRWARARGRPRAPDRLVRPAYPLAEVPPFEGVRRGAVIPGERPQRLPAALEML